MTRIDITTYVVATVLQIAALVFAFRVAKQVTDRRPWIALSGALLVMLAFRVFVLLDVSFRDAISPATAVLTSAFLLLALFFMRRVAAAERASRLEAALRTSERDESENRYRTLADLNPEAMFVEAGEKVVYANAAAAQLFGAKSANDLIGRPTRSIGMSETLPLARAEANTQHIGQSITPAVAQWQRLDGNPIAAEAVGAEIPWRGGQAVQVIVRDISERIRVEGEKTRLLASERTARSLAEHASRMKDEFLATLSHELRTPLNAILGWAQILRQNPTENEELKTGLETIERNARVQTELVEDLLDMSRIISGKLRLNIQRVIPATFVEAAMTAVRPAAEAKGIALETALDPTAGPISADPNRLQQVVWNLLTNAIKFTPTGGKVEVRLERVRSHIEIGVSDTGQGIAPEFLPHVFDRFRQADSSLTRKQGGLGLGLAIVKQLVELHGGTVQMSSGGEGKGASVIIRLPVAVVHTYVETEEPSARAPTNVAARDNAVSLRGVRVLIVDDEPDALAMLRRLLERSDAEVYSASSAAAAVKILNQTIPDVLVSDIGMPQKDGYEFMKDVRQRTPETGGRVPAIALTAFARSEDRTRALMAGYQVHISKPVEPRELLVTVASLIGKAAAWADAQPPR